MNLTFDCPRTCPLVRSPFCRFRPVLDGIGPVQVHSHTASVVVDWRDPDALRGAVLSIGGRWLGHSAQRLYDGSTHTGLAFFLPGWTYPCVLERAGTGHHLAYDNFNGHWGATSELERLKAAYASQAVEQAALALGWLCERDAQGALLVHHPDGGTLALTGQGLDLTGFQGVGCHDALLQLGLPLEALQAKPEYGQVAAQVQLPAQ